MPKKIDLTGRVFGRLTVVEPAPHKKNPNSGRCKPQWHCRCVCGNHTTVLAENLRNRNTASCGCAAHQIVDKTERRYGKLTVVRRAPSRTTPSGKHVTYWECRCDCGATVFLPSKNLNMPYGTKSCGCLTKTRITTTHLKDLTGLVFGYYTVLSRSPIRKYNEVHWTCKCQCGTIKAVSGRSLRRGSVKSCGCYQKELRRHLCQERHPRWNSTTSLAARQLKRKSAIHLGLLAKRRDNWTCQCCGAITKQLVAHHIEAWHTALELRLQLANLISLCTQCHIEYHILYGQEDANLEELNDFLSHLTKGETQ